MEFNQNEYISPLIVAVCLCAGYIVKTSFDFVDNKYIPLIVAILGLVLSIWQNGLDPKAVACGLVSGLASTGTFELIKNVFEVIK